MALFLLVMLYIFLWCFFWHADMFNLHYDHFFFKQSKLQKIWSIIISEILLPLTTTIPNVTEPATLLTIRPFPYHLYSLPSIYFLPLFIASIDWIVWSRRCSCIPVSTHMVVISRNPHAFTWDKLVIAIVPKNLPHMLIFTIRNPDVILLYCIVDSVW